METAAAPSGNQPVKPDRLRAPAGEPGELQEVSGKYWWPLILAHFHNRNEIWRVRSNALITSYVREQDNASEARASILNILARGGLSLRIAPPADLFSLAPQRLLG